jgi:hypothetical protein
MKLLSSLFLILLVFSGPAGFAGAPLCAGLFAGTSSPLLDRNQALPSSFSIADLQRKNPGVRVFPDFTHPEKPPEILQYQNADFIMMGERVLFVVKDASSAPVWGILSGKEPQVQIQELPGITAYDISNSPLVSPLIRKINSKNAWFDGPNCWNLCQIHQGWAKTSFFTSHEEFNLWMESPFAKKKDMEPGSPGFHLNPGDLIVFRDRQAAGGKAMQEVHGAVALTNNLVLTKNGWSHKNAYEMMPIRAMLNHYKTKTSMTDAEFFSFEPFDQVWARWRPRLSPATVQFTESWMEFETHHGQYFLTGNSAKPPTPQQRQVLEDERNRLVTKMKPAVDATITGLAGTSQRNETQEVELFFLRLLRFRIYNEFYFTGVSGN